MSCTFKPNYTPYPFNQLSPTHQWGIGAALGYTRFNGEEFHLLEDEIKITFPIDFTGKVRGSSTPNPNSATSRAMHMNHDNILRGSKFLARPTALFNGAVYNEQDTYQGAAIATTQQPNQGLMFYWEDFLYPDARIFPGDRITVSVGVRSNGENVPHGAVALKATPNFTDTYMVSATPITKEFTRIVFETTYLGPTWEKPEGWDEFWGVENVTPPQDGLRAWNKDNLIGVIQAVEDIQLDFTQPMVSPIGATVYAENSADYMGNSTWSFDKAQAKTFVGSTGKLQVNKNSSHDFAMSEFIPIKKDAGHLSVYMFNKKQFEDTTGSGGNYYGRIVLYTGAEEGKFLQAYEMTRATGTYGGYLKTIWLPAEATHYRISVAVDGPQTAEVYAQVSNDDAKEFPQEWYDAMQSKLDGKTARAYGYIMREPVEMYFNWDVRKAIEKFMPNAFAGLTPEEVGTRLRTIAYRFDTTLVARGGSRVDGQYKTQAKWEFYKPSTNEWGLSKTFTSTGLEESTHKSTYQDWLSDAGTMVTRLSASGGSGTAVEGGQPWVEADYYATTMSIVLSRADAMAYGLDLKNTSIQIDSINLPTSRTENYQIGMAVQVTHGFDILTLVQKQYPEFFGDCYTRSDMIDKLNERIPSIRVRFRPIITDLDVGGSGYVEFRVEAQDPAQDAFAQVRKNADYDIIVNNGTIGKSVAAIVGVKTEQDLATEELMAEGLITPYQLTQYYNGETISYTNAEGETVTTTRVPDDAQASPDTFISKANFIQDNGYLYIGYCRPAEDRNTELAVEANISFDLYMDRAYDQLRRTFRYNNKKQPYYLFVRNIHREILGSKSNNLTAVNMGKRRWNFGQTEGQKAIVLDCFIKAPQEADVAELIEDLADYLDVGETTLQLSDNPERSYRVILDGSTEVSQSLHIGDFSLTFALLENDAIGKEVAEYFEFDRLDPQPIAIDYKGTATAYPTYYMTLAEQVGYMDLIGAGESNNISLGRRPSEGSEDKTPTEMKPLVLDAKFTKTDGVNWSLMTDEDVPDLEGYAAVELQGTPVNYDANGRFDIRNYDYGDGNNGWHGNGIKAPLKRNVKNFIAETFIKMYGNQVKQALSGVFVILYDESGAPLTYTKLGSRPQEGWLDSYISPADDFTKHSKSINNKNKWNDFQGKLIVERRENQWKVIVGQFKDRRYQPAPDELVQQGSYMMRDVVTTNWIDLPYQVWDKKISSIGIFIGQYRHRPKFSHISVRRVRVWEDLTEYGGNDDEVTNPVMINAGDTVVIDSSKSQVLVNGQITPSLVDPMTDWFGINKGQNIITVNNFKGSLAVVYNERFR